MRSRVLATLVVAGCLVSSCADAKTTEKGADGVTVASSTATFAVRGSVNQVGVTGAEKGAELVLVDSGSEKIATGTTDAQGSYVFRLVPAGAGYRVQTTADTASTSDPIEVKDAGTSLPDQSFYDTQSIIEDDKSFNFTYITTRDGTTLSASVYLPGPASDGPYPTVVEYSGYSPSNPTNDSLKKTLQPLLGDNLTEVCKTLPIACQTPDQPASELASAMGYAVVAVNLRGTGCSGGSYDFFEPLQLLDGYDVIETVAAQPWVLNHKVGMVGLSYPGIAQLFVASTQPPSLAAITPLSVFDDTARGILAPGGMFNEGFALQWVRKVLEEAEPEGQAWTKGIIEKGDTVCADNQKMRLQNVDAVSKAKQNPFYTDEVAGPLNPMVLVQKINVPVFVTGGWQDEQTGSRFARLFPQFTSSPVVKFTGFNGAHADGFAPNVLTEWKAFLDIYVAGKVTGVPETVRQFGPLLFQDVFGATLSFPKDRWSTTDPLATTKAAFESEPGFRVIFESGGSTPIGGPVGRFEHRFESYPFEGTEATSWYLQPDGSLGADASTATSAGSDFRFDKELASKVTLPGDSENDAFKALPKFQWDQDLPGGAAVFETKALTTSTVMAGTGSADLWIRSTADDADLSVTLSEIRPDGKETLVQSGWLRASNRALAEDATELDPNISAYEKDAKPLVPGEWTEVKIQIHPFGHIFRAGSKIRISVHSPGGDKPRWAWITKDYPADTTFAVAHDAEHPSRIILPAIPSLTGFPKDRPKCPSLRGQPCRDSFSYSNTPAK